MRRAARCSPDTFRWSSVNGEQASLNPFAAIALTRPVQRPCCRHRRHGNRLARIGCANPGSSITSAIYSPAVRRCGSSLRRSPGRCPGLRIVVMDAVVRRILRIRRIGGTMTMSWKSVNVWMRPMMRDSRA